MTRMCRQIQKADFRLEGLHGKYPLQKWARECDVARLTLQAHVERISKEEREGLRMVGIL
jgi:hypothetical protein